MTSLYISIAMFALGAMVGVYLLSFVLRGMNTPKFVVFVHGIFVVVALILLITYAQDNPGYMETIVIFVLAAIGGLVLFFRDITSKPMPKWLGIGHGLIAVAGFVFLLMNAFGK